MSGEDGGDSGDKQHEATPRRLQRAREEGDLPQSRDAQTFAAYAGFGAAAILAGDWATEQIGATLIPFLDRPEELAQQLLSPGAGEALGGLATGLGPPVLVLLATPAAVVLALLLALQGIVIAPRLIEPKLSRISPLSNARNKYGTHGMVEFGKSAAKLALLGIVVGMAIWGEADRLARYAILDVRLTGPLLMHQFRLVFTGVLAVAAALAAFDLVFQHLHHRKKLRMTHQELKEEGKQSEGDPHMRAQRRERARQIATNRMLNDVPGADVVVANPTHFAVALKWSRAEGAAPVCVAKGVDAVALAIRERAEAAGVPVHVDAPAARALHGVVEIGHEIPVEQYQAVAAAIIFADEMRRKVRERAR